MTVVVYLILLPKNCLQTQTLSQIKLSKNKCEKKHENV